MSSLMPTCLPSHKLPGLPGKVTSCENSTKTPSTSSHKAPNPNASNPNYKTFKKSSLLWNRASHIRPLSNTSTTCPRAIPNKTARKKLHNTCNSSTQWEPRWLPLAYNPANSFWKSPSARTTSPFAYLKSVVYWQPTTSTSSAPMLIRATTAQSSTSFRSLPIWMMTLHYEKKFNKP